MKIHKILRLDHLLDYRADWNNILEMNQNNNPFIEFDWIYHWLTYFQPFYELNFYAVEHENEMIAFFPFIKKKGRIYDSIQFAGYGQANYMDIVAAEKWKDDAIRYVISEISKQKKTVFILHGLLDSTGILDALIRQFTDLRISFHTSQTVAPYIDLEELENFEAFIKKKMKKHGGDRKEKRLKKLGKAVFLPLKNDQLDAMFQLHKKRWLAKLDTSGFTKGLTHEFYKSLTSVQNGVLETKLDGLFIEDRLVAFLYGFICRNRYVLYTLSHDDDFGVFSPGRILLKETVRDRFVNQIRNYDLSIGYEPYKLDWNTGMDRASKVIFPGTGLMARFGFWHMALKDKLIGLLKKNKGLVDFKRNTLGKIKNFFQGFTPSLIKKMAGDFFFQKHSFEVYRADRPFFEKKIQSNDFQLITIKEIFKYPSFFQGNMNAIIRRLYQKQQGYCLIQDGHPANCFWVNEKEICIERFDMAEPLPENSAFIYEWLTFDVNAVAALFQKNNKLNHIYITIPSNCKHKQSFQDQGFAIDHHFRKITFFGFSFVRSGIFHSKKE
jgi:CelD/BcsL family acetyltransferase involved in cellulose biosynthesis